jgi:protein-S-isoprenylcysteine O-methyltransferase Ste14
MAEAATPSINPGSTQLAGDEPAGGNLYGGNRAGRPLSWILSLEDWPPALLDRGEQALVVALWSLLVARVLASPNSHAWLVLVSEAMVMALVLLRRPTPTISRRSGDWLMALAATAAPLLITPGPDLFPRLDPVGVALVAAGNALQLAAKLALRRSFGIAPAHRGLKMGGPYALVRHPMYAGYLLVHIGVLVLMPSPVNVLIYALGWTAQIRRLLAEEALLGQDEAYRAYCGRVRWRLVPGVF